MASSVHTLSRFTRLASATALIAIACVRCAVPPTRTASEVPEDFAVEIVVQTAGAVDQQQAHLRASKFLLQPGGEFATAIGRGVNDATVPAPTRLLDPRQVAELWTMIRSSNFIPDQTDIVVGAGARPRVVATEQKATTMAAIWVRADGRSRWWHLPLDGTAPDANAVRLVRTCDALAWASDVAPERVVPARFDFGDDPYASFRKPTEQP
ncbi:MAG: hypothetical protein O2800_00765 [Planctomycetota bacterium]|nr:hypothetical protein [Planctomycetota bacterium]